MKGGGFETRELRAKMEVKKRRLDCERSVAVEFDVVDNSCSRTIVPLQVNRDGTTSVTHWRFPGLWSTRAGYESGASHPQFLHLSTDASHVEKGESGRNRRSKNETEEN